MTPEVFAPICAAHAYQMKGMFYSEVFLFLEACSRLRIDLILESGVKNGMSTRLMAAASLCEIVSIDRNPVAADAVFPGVRLLKGDSLKLVPKLLKEYPERRVAVLIDGPKGLAALGLKDLCLSAANCFLVGVHDARDTHVPEVLPGIVRRHSWDHEFFMSRRVFDVHVPESWRRKYPMGPGLGLWEKL